MGRVREAFWKLKANNTVAGETAGTEASPTGCRHSSFLLTSPLRSSTRELFQVLSVSKTVGRKCTAHSQASGLCTVCGPFPLPTEPAAHYSERFNNLLLFCPVFQSRASCVVGKDSTTNPHQSTISYSFGHFPPLNNSHPTPNLP